jgi:hypothetical protein
VFGVAGHSVDAGVSGFGAWQLTLQDGGPPGADAVRYRLLGAGPEASASIGGPFSVRLRAHWEFGAREIVRGNNLWLIVNYRF